MLKKLLLLLVTLAPVSCAHSAFSKLPEEDQQLWNRCFEPMATANGCNKSNTALGVLISDSTCTRYKMDPNEYLSLERTSSRKTWLIAHGCPPYMVRPERY